MADKKSPQNGRTHLQENPKNNRFDLLMSRSESPHVQTILLHQKLKEDIERNPDNRIRYVDSELHFRNTNNRSLATRNPTSNPSVAIAGSNLAIERNNPHLDMLNNKKDESTVDTGCDKQQPTRNDNQSQQNNLNGSCQVCIIKDMTQDLMRITKMVRERNEQLCKLKSKYLRSYFERLNK